MDSTSDKRVVNNVMRHEYRVLDGHEKSLMQEVKDRGLDFWQFIDQRLGTSREASIAKTLLEEVVMWAVKHITK